MNRESDILLSKLINGQISASELHQLEKMAIDDPFLFDAIEGYTLSNANDKNYNNEIDHLKNKILTTQKKSIPWLGWAAIFLGISISALYIFNTNSLRKEYEEYASLPNEETSAPSIVNNSEPLHLEDSTSTDNSPKPMERVVSSAENNVENSDIELEANDEEKVQITSKANKSRKSIIGSLVDETGSNAVFDHWTLQNFDTKQAFSVNQDGSFNIELNDSLGTSEPFIVFNDGQLVKGVSLNPERQNLIYITSLESADDMPQVDMTTQRAKAISESMERKLDKVNSYAPSMNMKYFLEWIDKNRNIPIEAFEKNFKGKIIVNFTIYSDGSIGNITAENSECKDCEKEAIRLISKSGRWVTTPPHIETNASFKISFE
ncbi:MAG TPA: hypothetical protein PK147_02720 [Saprospiraceae bacterium]|nr:hypothetical protein [Saprospiraceae bacterium]MCB9327834.1 hypothetical protein [Lewinellaceae bacterium]HPQ20732.1 hypothetical protein [Saprospiraceae bacterium]HRX27827.1 hypothetical protein [Saprospiraceae bacterium]